MKVSRITGNDMILIQEGCRAFGIELREIRPQNKCKTSFRFQARPIKGNQRTWGKINPISGRKVFALNWYGFKKVIEAIYHYAPNAKVETMEATYNSKEEFESAVDSTKEWNSDHPIHRQLYGPHSFYYGTTVYDTVASDKDGFPLD